MISAQMENLFNISLEKVIKNVHKEKLRFLEINVKEWKEKLIFEKIAPNH